MVVRRDLLDDAELIGGFGDYDEKSPDSEYERHVALAAPWYERRTDGVKQAYLPTSPRTLQPSSFSRAWREWAELVDGVRGKSTGGGAPGLWSYDREALANPRLARLRAGLAYVRRDAAFMARWMDRHGRTVGPRANRVYELFFLQGYRRRSIANKLGILPCTVDSFLHRLRSQAGSPAIEPKPMRVGALVAPGPRMIMQRGLLLQPLGRATGRIAGYG